MTKIKWAFLLLIAPLLVILTYQNCGQFNPGSERSSNSSLSEPSPDPTPTPNPDPEPDPEPIGFMAGDVFDYERLPNKSQMLDQQIRELNYNSNAQGKAVAINNLGLGFASIGKATVAEAERTALESCFLLGGQLPCVVVGSGNFFKINQADLVNAYTFTFTVEPAVNSRIPFVTDAARVKIVSEYNAAPAPKALAISIDGAYSWINQPANVTVNNTAYSITLERITNTALARCEMNAGFNPCFIYAQNSNVVFNLTQLKRTANIDYAKSTIGTANGQQLMGIAPRYYLETLRPNYINRITNTNFGAIYVTRTGGAVGYAVTTNNQGAADAAALTMCRGTGTTPRECFKYATKLNIHNLLAFQSAVARPGIKCRAMVRQSCAAHQAMGCVNGSFYIMQGGMPNLTNCP